MPQAGQVLVVSIPDLYLTLGRCVKVSRFLATESEAV